MEGVGDVQDGILGWVLFRFILFWVDKTFFNGVTFIIPHYLCL